MTVSAAQPSAPVAPEDAQRLVQETVQRAGSSFFWGMRLLPRERRQAIYAVYAYCREVDDIADGAEPDDVKLPRLQSWREEVERLYTGRPTNAITHALARANEEFDLPKAELLAVLDGMERDARGGIIAPTNADLRSYCRQVAGAVGVLAMQIFAKGDPRADAGKRMEIAVALGDALQLTNILRDLGDDASRGRVYLPQELLDRAGVAARTPEALLKDPALPRACAELAGTARQSFHRTRTLLNDVSRRTARPCRLMLEVYAKLLDRLEAGGWQHPEQRLRVPRREKYWIVLRHGLL